MPKREDIEWTDIWVEQVNRDDLPRVLMIGDSIVRGYYPKVAELLRDKAYCGRYTTSLFAGEEDYLAMLRGLLRRDTFDVIHVNNGLHGWVFTEDEYRDAIKGLLALLTAEAPKAKLVWATSTPVRRTGELSEMDERNTRVIARNAIAAEIMSAANVPVNDLYALLIDQADLFNNDGIHYDPPGRELQGRYVAAAILDMLADC